MKLKRKLDKADKISVLFFAVINIYLVWLIIANAGYFYLDTPYCMLIDKITGWGGKGFYFHEIDRFYPMTFTIQALTATYLPNIPLTHFLVQYFYFIMGIIGVLIFTSRFTPKVTYMISSAVLFYSVSPFSENMLTIGKMELLLTTCFIWFLFSIYDFVWNEKARGIICIIIESISVIIAFLTKETSLIMLVPIVLLTIYTVFFMREKWKRVMVVSAIFFLIFLLFRLYNYIYVAKGSYLTYDIQIKTILTSYLWYFKYHFDLILIGLCSVAMSFVGWIKNKRNYRFAFLLIISLTGWAYFIAIGAWRWTQSYYLYGLSAFFILPFLNVMLDSINSSYIKRKIFYIGLITVLFYSVNYNYKVAFSHFDNYKVYTESMNWLAENTEEDARILIENYDYFYEPVYETRYMMRLLNHENVTVLGINQSINQKNIDADILKLWNTTEEEYNKMVSEGIPQIGDYIVVFFNKRNFYGPIRGINPDGGYNTDGSSSLPDKGYKLELMSENKLTRKWPCYSLKKLIDTAEAGYKIYRVSEIL